MKSEYNPHILVIPNWIYMRHANKIENPVNWVLGNGEWRIDCQNLKECFCLLYFILQGGEKTIKAGKFWINI